MNTTSLSLWATSALCIATLSACGGAKEYSIDQKLDTIVKQLAVEEPNKPITEEMRKRLREQLEQQAAIAKAARDDKLDQAEDVKVLAALDQERSLVAKYLRTKMEAYNPSDDELRKKYDAQINEFKGEGPVYHLRHILVEDAATAAGIIAKLKAGESFDTLAKLSKDPGSAQKGGDLGWNSLDKWVPEFKAAAAKLKKGELTATPVRSEYGFHVIQNMDEPQAAPPFESVKPQLLEQAKNDYVIELTKKFAPK